MDAKTELILIRITGLDRPGLTASFTEILSGYDVTIMDIGQANIHSTLSLGILFKSHKADSGNIMKELLFKMACSMVLTFIPFLTNTVPRVVSPTFSATASMIGCPSKSIR